MNVLWIYAHPEPRSLNGALRDDGVQTLRELGHEVRESDLYAMKWNPVVDAADYAVPEGERLVVAGASKQAYTEGRLSPEVVAEQEKLAWADTVVVQFPLWWYGMPAILKGWFDRVFVKGFAYGVARPDGKTARYGEGMLTGKRALTVLTIGGHEESYGPRGINGSLEDLLFGLHHGTFWYPGMASLRPFAVYGADRVPPGKFTGIREGLRARLSTLDTDEPLSYRTQNGGDYDEDLVLDAGIEPGADGFAVHRQA